MTGSKREAKEEGKGEKLKSFREREGGWMDFLVGATPQRERSRLVLHDLSLKRSGGRPVGF